MIELPWPNPALNPNARNRWKRIEARKKQREDSFYLAKTVEPFKGDKIPIDIIFHPPDKRRRDLDNCLAMMKGAIDGISDSFGIDDRVFYPITLDWGNVVKGGKVVIKQKGQ